MADFDDIKVFGKTSLSDLFKQIHSNNKNTDAQIEKLISTMIPLATTSASSAAILMPIVNSLLENGVKNSDQLVKLAAIVQRAAAANNNGDDDGYFNTAEMMQLIEEQKQLQISQKQLENTPEIKQLENK